MKIAVIHFGRLANSNETASNLDENEQNLLNLNMQAAKEGADLIVNPEASILPFFSTSTQTQITGENREIIGNRMFARWFAEERSPRFIERLRSTVALPYQTFIVVGTITSVPGYWLLHNSALVIGPKDIQHIYHKRVLTDDVVFSCVKGFSELLPVNLTIGKLGVIICGDYSVPLIPRSLALNGSDLIVIIAAVTSPTTHVLQVRALENGIPFVLANCYNRDQQHIEPWVPESSIVAANGEVLDAYNRSSNKILWADLDVLEPAMQELKTERLRSRRPECYVGALIYTASPLLRPHTADALTESAIKLVTISGAAIDQHLASDLLDTIIRTAAEDDIPVIIVLPEFSLEKKDIQKYIHFGVERKVSIVCGFTENNSRVISLFDPSGREILTYKKVHLSKEESAVIQAGERLECYIDHLAGRIG
ncbi:MAG TPA: nitrilase-related carbon-nitrogen hydrolase, partial [Ktedonobacteraceae bacterium]|nr:nitrilase-related carbon-nitrogen hydrolase [Ktedonobacteraceae bacterium]